MSAPRARLLACGLAALVTMAACSSNRPPPRTNALGDELITVGSFDFPESELLAELYSQALERAGYKVHRLFAIGSRELVGPAQVAGLVEVVPEYAGTALQFHALGEEVPTGDADATHEALDRVLRSRGLIALRAAAAQNVNTFVVTQRTAERRGMATLSDLAAVSEEMTIGGPPECPSRPLCLLGLEDTYAAEFKQFVRLDTGGAVSRQALIDGFVDVALLFSTDPALDDGQFVDLVDDQGLQPAENITPVVHREVLEHFGDRVASAIDAVSSQLKTEDVREMNHAVQGGRAVADVSREWLEAR